MRSSQVVKNFQTRQKSRAEEIQAKSALPGCGAVEQSLPELMNYKTFWVWTIFLVHICSLVAYPLRK